jgi:hypothetical protein
VRLKPATRPKNITLHQARAAVKRYSRGQPMTDEHTSPGIASEAAKVIGMSDVEVAALALVRPDLIRSLAASALTQTRDHDDKA